MTDIYGNLIRKKQLSQLVVFIIEFRIVKASLTYLHTLIISNLHVDVNKL